MGAIQKRMVAARRAVRTLPTAAMVTHMVRTKAGTYPSAYMTDAMRNAVAVTCDSFNTLLPWDLPENVTSACVCRRAFFVARAAPNAVTLLGDTAAVPVGTVAARCGVIHIVSAVDGSDARAFPPSMTTTAADLHDGMRDIVRCVVNDGATVVVSEAAVAAFLAAHGTHPVEAMWTAMHPDCARDDSAYAWDAVRDCLTTVFDVVPTVVYEGPRDRAASTPTHTVTQFDAGSDALFDAAEELNNDTPDDAPKASPTVLATAHQFVAKYGAPLPPGIAVDDAYNHRVATVMATVRAMQAGPLPATKAALDTLFASGVSSFDTPADLADHVHTVRGIGVATCEAFTHADNIARAAAGPHRRLRLRGSTCTHCGCDCETLNTALHAAAQTVLGHAGDVARIVGCHRCHGAIDVATPVFIPLPHSDAHRVVNDARTDGCFTRVPYDRTTGALFTGETDTTAYLLMDPVTATPVVVHVGGANVVDLTSDGAGRPRVLGACAIVDVPGVTFDDDDTKSALAPCITVGCGTHWTWAWNPDAVHVDTDVGYHHPGIACKGCTAIDIARGNLAVCFGCSAATPRHSPYTSLEPLDSGLGGTLCATCATTSRFGCATCGRLVSFVTIGNTAPNMLRRQCAACRNDRPVSVCCVPFAVPGVAMPPGVCRGRTEFGLRLAAYHGVDTDAGWDHHTTCCCPFTDRDTRACVQSVGLKDTPGARGLRAMAAIDSTTGWPSWSDAAATKDRIVGGEDVASVLFPCGCPRPPGLPRDRQYVSCDPPRECPYNPHGVSAVPSAVANPTLARGRTQCFQAAVREHHGVLASRSTLRLGLWLTAADPVSAASVEAPPAALVTRLMADVAPMAVAEPSADSRLPTVATLAVDAGAPVTIECSDAPCVPRGAAEAMWAIVALDDVPVDAEACTVDNSGSHTHVLRVALLDGDDGGDSPGPRVVS